MSGHLQKELKQQKPFGSLEQEVVLNVMRTAGSFRKGVSEVLKPFDLSSPQYNILRILRGAPEDGLPCSEVGDRLVGRDPDVTRLLDRLEKRELVERGRSLSDRRVVNARITAPGISPLPIACSVVPSGSVCAVMSAGVPGGGMWSWMRSGSGGALYVQKPRTTLNRPISSMPPVTGIQYRRCFFENGLARSFATQQRSTADQRARPMR